MSKYLPVLAVSGLLAPVALVGLPVYLALYLVTRSALKLSRTLTFA